MRPGPTDLGTPEIQSEIESLGGLSNRLSRGGDMIYANGNAKVVAAFVHVSVARPLSTARGM